MNKIMSGSSHVDGRLHRADGQDSLDENDSLSERYMQDKRTSLFARCFSKPKEYKRESTEDARNKKQGRTLPHCIIYLSW